MCLVVCDNKPQYIYFFFLMLLKMYLKNKTWNSYIIQKNFNSQTCIGKQKQKINIEYNKTTSTYLKIKQQCDGNRAINFPLNTCITPVPHLHHTCITPAPHLPLPSSPQSQVFSKYWKDSFLYWKLTCLNLTYIYLEAFDSVYPNLRVEKERKKKERKKERKREREK